MEARRVRPSRTKERSCNIPCQVREVELRVGSVVKASPASARPEQARKVDPNREAGAGLRSEWRRRAKMKRMNPLRTKVAIIHNPYGPRESPLGQSKVGALMGSQPNPSRKSYCRMVRTISMDVKSRGQSKKRRFILNVRAAKSQCSSGERRVEWRSVHLHRTQVQVSRPVVEARRSIIITASRRRGCLFSCQFRAGNFL